MQYLAETISFTKDQITHIFKQTTPAQREFAEKVKIAHLFHRVESRIDDAEKVVEGLKREVAGLQRVVATLSDKQMKWVYDGIQDSTRSTEEVLVASERSRHALTIIEVVVAGTLAPAFFKVLGIIDFIQTLFVSAHTIVFLLALGSWALVAGLLFVILQYLTKRSEPHLAMNLRFDKPITVSKLESYLEDKPVTSRISKHDGISEIMKVTWSESDKQQWLGEAPTLSITYDAKNSYLLSFAAECDNPHIDQDKMRKLMQTEVARFFRQNNRNQSSTKVEYNIY